MNSKTTKAKYLKFAVLIISVSFILGAISACLPFNMSVPELDNNAISNTVATITQNSSDGLGEFNDGYTYVYTDRTKIDKYRAGDESTPYDITTVKVDKTNNARGTQKNPYVISTTSDWPLAPARRPPLRRPRRSVRGSVPLSASCTARGWPGRSPSSTAAP